MDRLEQIIDKATDILGSRAEAEEWVDKVSATLGVKPRAMAATDEGTRTVLLHLAAISRHARS